MMPPFNIIIPGKTQLKLHGQCNKCGLCCMPERNGKLFRCMNLRIEGIPGHPNASHCVAYNQRYTGMPIFMVNMATGLAEEMGVCAHDSIVEPEIIAPYIGKGCSMFITKG